MRAVIQRVSNAQVVIDHKLHAQIKNGLLLLVGIEESDSIEDVLWLTKKIIQMRIFADHEGQMNKSINDVDGDILVVSQFTLHAKTKKGNRPSFINAAKPKLAIPLYEAFVKQLELLLANNVKTGVFGADMQVSLSNDGPVTILIDSKRKE